MVPVYGNSLPHADFLSAVDKMFNTLFTFTASGSGWIVDEIVDLDVISTQFVHLPISLLLLNWTHLACYSTLETVRITISSCTVSQLPGTLNTDLYSISPVETQTQFEQAHRLIRGATL